MVRECRPPAREPTRSGLVRRSTMATSTPANANSPANISPVGPPPATTTACSAILLNLRTKLRSQRRTERGACGKPRGALYIEGGKEWVLSFPLIIPVDDQALCEAAARRVRRHRPFLFRPVVM